MNKTERSKEMYYRADKISPGGVHSNIRYFNPYPLFFSRAKGSKLWDVNGNQYIDCVVNMGACILGHGSTVVTEAVRNQVLNGLTCSVETELSIEVAEKLSNMIPCAETVKFSNTGTEAVMKALMIARGFSGREKIVKIEGGYNGWYDCVLTSFRPKLDQVGPENEPFSIPENQGVLRDMTKKTLIVPFNNLEAMENIVRKNRNSLAAVLVEPIQFNMGCVVPKSGYLEAIREITQKNDVLLIFDEVISGFRTAPGGAQEYYGVKPDMATFAKAIANGFPLSAVTGRADILEITRPGGKVSYGGLFNGNQSSLAASLATLSILEKGQVQKNLNRKTELLKKRFLEITEKWKIKTRIQGMAGQFQIYFTDREVVDYRTALKSNNLKFLAFQQNMIRNGIYFIPNYLFHHGLTIKHTVKDIEVIIEAIQNSLKFL